MLCISGSRWRRCCAILIGTLPIAWRRCISRCLCRPSVSLRLWIAGTMIPIGGGMMRCRTSRTIVAHCWTRGCLAIAGIAGSLRIGLPISGVAILLRIGLSVSSVTILLRIELSVSSVTVLLRIRLPISSITILLRIGLPISSITILLRIGLSVSSITVLLRIWIISSIPILLLILSTNHICLELLGVILIGSFFVGRGLEKDGFFSVCVAILTHKELLS